VNRESRTQRILFQVAVGIILLVGVTVVYVQVTAPSEDCVNHATARVTIILDRTSSYSKIQRLNLDKTVAEIVRGAPSNAQINVFYMTKDGGQPRTVLSLCRPNDVNPINGDPDDFRFWLQRKVVDQIRKVIDLPIGNGEHAPIVETLDTLSRERLLSRDNGPDAIYLFSGMIQNSPNGSLDGCMAPGQERTQGLAVYIADVQQFYRGTPFYVYELLRNPPQEQPAAVRACIRLFWEHVLPEVKSWEPL